MASVFIKEDEGVAYRGTFLVNPEGLVKIAEIQDNSIGVMLMNWYVRLKLLSSLLLTRVRFAQLSGSRAARH